MRNQKKLWGIFILGTIIVVIILLASSLSHLEFSQGQPFFLDINDQSQDIREISFMKWSLDGVWKWVATLILWVFIPISVIYFVISPEGRKKALQRAIPLAIFAYALFMLMRQSGNLKTESPFAFDKFVDTVSSSENPIDAIFQSEPSQWVNIIANLMFIFFVIGTAWFIFQRLQNAVSPLDKLNIEVKKALTNLESGVDLRSTVLRCYAEMSRVIREQKGIKRNAAMTPREFEQNLHAIGLPEINIVRLTRLFEDVRYGDKKLGVEDERVAIDCLEAIVEACEAAQ